MVDKDKDDSEKLDNNWINNFEKTYKLYEDYYKDDIYFTNIHFIYINKNNHIEKISEDKFVFNTPNLISKEELLKILKKNMYVNNKHYTILSIIKFIVNLEQNEIMNFLKFNNNEYTNNFLQIIKNIDDIKFEKSINMFHEVNDLFFIFYEKTASNNVTKKIYLKNALNKTNDKNKKHNKTFKNT